MAVALWKVGKVPVSYIHCNFNSIDHFGLFFSVLFYEIVLLVLALLTNSRRKTCNSNSISSNILCINSVIKLRNVAKSMDGWMVACICTHVCMYVCTYVRTYVRMNVCMYVCMYVWMYVCMHVWQGPLRKSVFKIVTTLLESLCYCLIKANNLLHKRLCHTPAMNFLLWD